MNVDIAYHRNHIVCITLPYSPYTPFCLLPVGATQSHTPSTVHRVRRHSAMHSALVTSLVFARSLARSYPLTGGQLPSTRRTRCWKLDSYVQKENVPGRWHLGPVDGINWQGFVPGVPEFPSGLLSGRIAKSPKYHSSNRILLPTSHVREGSKARDLVRLSVTCAPLSERDLSSLMVRFSKSR